MRMYVINVVMMAVMAFALAGCGGDGGTSTPGTIATNTAPVANAGSTQSVVLGTVVTLNGSASSDADGDPLTYRWFLTSKPTGSNVTLTGTTTANPTFTPDIAGNYVFELLVNDREINSEPATVTVTASVANAAPVANAGSNKNVKAGDIVVLDGSGSSDADGDPLTYSWTFTSIPNGSQAVLAGADSYIPAFTTDVAGVYILQLVVNDGTSNSTAATVKVTAASLNPPAEQKVSAYVTIKDSYFSGMSLCSFDSTIGIGAYYWTFTNCRIYGPAGNVVVATVTNNTNATQRIESFSYRYNNLFVQNYSVNANISPNETLIYNIPLNVGADITDSTVTFKIKNLPDTIGNFTINQ